jgi:leader peptidase (prepilin peptidase) / N-methyltransferase
VLGWTSWQALIFGAFSGFVLAALYGGVYIATRRAMRTTPRQSSVRA